MGWPIPVFIVRFYWNTVLAFVDNKLQQQSWAAAGQTTRAATPTKLTTWRFTQNMQPLFYTTRLLEKDTAASGMISVKPSWPTSPYSCLLRTTLMSHKNLIPLHAPSAPSPLEACRLASLGQLLTLMSFLSRSWDLVKHEVCKYYIRWSKHECTKKRLFLWEKSMAF